MSSDTNTAVQIVNLMLFYIINQCFKINIIIFAFLPKMNTENQNDVHKLLPECRFVPSLKLFCLFNFSKQQMEIKVVKCEDTE